MNYTIKYEKLSTWINPALIFETLFENKPYAFWLDSNMPQNKFSRYSYMGIPDEIINYSLTKKKLTIQKNQKTNHSTQDIFSYLKVQLTKRKIKTTKLPFDFIGGYIGYFGYELKALCSAKNSHQSPYPDSLWYFAKNTIVLDHKKKQIYLVCLTNKKENKNDWIKKTKHTITKSIKKTPPTTRKNNTPHPHNQIEFKMDRNSTQYIKDIEKCKTYLKNGESYEICLTNTITTKATIDPLNLYTNLRKKNPAPYSSYIKYKNLSILCSSPEKFISIDKKQWVESKPIKGTIARGKTKEEDKLLAKQLQESEKDRAENLMIVDLVRNDLGKVCEIGSVSVPKLMKVESYKSVHQLVSTIKGKLKKDTSIIDCIQACFPGGSMTGAPKIRTMEIIDSIEKKARGIYSGTIGFLSLNQTTSLNIVIRTIIINGNTISIGTGGAITALSDPKKEYNEIMIKAKLPMQIIEESEITQQTKINKYQ